MKLITHSHLVPRLRMSGVIPLLPVYAFIASFFFIVTTSSKLILTSVQVVAWLSNTEGTNLQFIVEFKTSLT
jgi:uncharacterized membrane protein (GlpM family)